jgi:hypothetical protein
MAEDRGAFKTNPAHSRQIPAIVMIRHRRCDGTPGPKKAPLRVGGSRSRRRFFHKRQEAVAVFSIEPDSLRAGGVRCVVNAASPVVTAFPVAPAKAEFASMLPGFRFLFAATVFSMSVLVFGLGAAALLRAAHEEFANTPSWHAPPETVFAQPSEATKPVLALLRVDTPVVEKPSDDVPAATAPAEPPANVSMPAEPESIAALKAEETSPETAKPEIPVSEASPPGEATPAQADAPAPAPAPAEETRIAATEPTMPPANQAAPAESEPISVRASPEAGPLSTKIATLGGPAVPIETPPQAKATSEKPDKNLIKARRAAQRRRRARLAAQAPQLQQPANPFAQPTITVRQR